jgi:hypothetical protein
MVTSALVVTLLGDDEVRLAAASTLSADPRLTLGVIEGRRLPVVAETSGLAAAEALVEGLLEVTGVAAVDVVRVDFDPELDVGGGFQFGRRARRDSDREESGHGST